MKTKNKKGGAKMMEVKRVKVVVNGKEYVEYLYNNKKYSNLADLLRENFANRGEFYEKVFGINREDAELAGWGPHCKDFSGYGFSQFVKDRGKIQKQIFEETISLRQAIQEEFFKD